MPSPFPGMNPFLEQRDAWQDFHQAFLAVLRRQVERQLGRDFSAKLEETVYVHEISDDEDDNRLLLGRPDVAVTRGPDFSGSDWGRDEAGVATLEAPSWAALMPHHDTQRLARIEIRDRLRRRLVTAIELLSPNVKRPGPDREQYLNKRKALVHSPAHLVELDLLRGGMRVPMQGLVDCNYCVLVSHAEHRPRVGVWPVRLREPLPTVPIPVTPEHPPVTLDLMASLHETYDAAGYWKYIYDGEPDPPLHPEDAKWAVGLIEGGAGVA